VNQGFVRRARIFPSEMELWLEAASANVGVDILCNCRPADIAIRMM
jgi:hypothetical protein